MDKGLKWKIVKPACTISVTGILRSWAEEWNEGLNADCTEKWELVDIHILKDRDIALRFRLPVVEYTGNINKEITKKTIVNNYRVLIFNMDNGFKTKYRFSMQAGYATNIHFIKGCLNATVYPFGGESCTLLQMWPGGNDEGQIRVGKNVSDHVVSSDGQLYVSYGSGGEAGFDEPFAVIKRFDDEGEHDALFTDIFTGMQSIRIDEEDNLYGVATDFNKAMIWNPDNTVVFDLPVEHAKELFPGASGEALYVKTYAKDEGTAVFRLPLNKEETPTQRVVVEHEGGITGTFDFAVLGWYLAAMYVNGKVYVVELE